MPLYNLLRKLIFIILTSEESKRERLHDILGDSHEILFFCMIDDDSHEFNSVSHKFVGHSHDLTSVSHKLMAIRTISTQFRSSL